MRFLAIIYGSQDLWSTVPPEEWEKGVADQNAFMAAHRENGEIVVSFGLGDESEAKVVRLRNGAPVITDGPYLETREYIASGWLLEVADFARAAQIVAEMPVARWRDVEMWPVPYGDS